MVTFQHTMYILFLFVYTSKKCQRYLQFNHFVNSQYFYEVLTTNFRSHLSNRPLAVIVKRWSRMNSIHGHVLLINLNVIFVASLLNLLQKACHMCTRLFYYCSNINCTSDPNLLIDAGKIHHPTYTRTQATCNRELPLVSYH